MSVAAPDLVVLVADKNMEFAVRGLMSRPKALKIRPTVVELFVHPERDPGCYRKAQDFLQPMIRRFSHALVIFDREGSGSENRSRETIERNVNSRLDHSGWGDRARTVVIDPELEQWVWSDSPHVAECLGWSRNRGDLRSRLEEIRMWPSESEKPPDPKAAVERVLHMTRKPRSSSVYKKLGERVGLNRCADPAFHEFVGILRKWFPPHRDSRDVSAP
jgi:hypothetical protein